MPGSDGDEITPDFLAEELDIDRDGVTTYLLRYSDVRDPGWGGISPTRTLVPKPIADSIRAQRQDDQSEFMRHMRRHARQRNGAELELSISKAAELVGVTPATIRTWIHRGKLRYSNEVRRTLDIEDVLATSASTGKRARRESPPETVEAALAALNQAVLMCRRAGVRDIAARVARIERTGRIHPKAEIWDYQTSTWRPDYGY
jgi:hypothetical protein